jgi:phosphatidylcholine synthase
MNKTKIIAACVHLYTASGLVISLVAAMALRSHAIELFLSALWLAVIVDSTDGVLARHYKVKQVLPSFSGRRLDDITDYITYVFLPVIGMIEFGVLPVNLSWLAVFPLLASGYGFCQDIAKTEESFVGFPSYWNVLFIYLYLLKISTGWVVVLLLTCAVLVFVPIRYIYPSRTRWLQKTTLALSFVYGILMAIICLFAQKDWIEPVVKVSLFYPAYYTIISLLHHRRIMKYGNEVMESDCKSGIATFGG